MQYASIKALSVNKALFCTNVLIKVSIETYLYGTFSTLVPLRWRHNGGDSVSNHQPQDCLLNRLFRRRSKKTSKLRVTGPCAGRGPVNSTHKWPVTRKMFPFNDVIMASAINILTCGDNTIVSVYLVSEMLQCGEILLDLGNMYDNKRIATIYPSYL